MNFIYSLISSPLLLVLLVASLIRILLPPIFKIVGKYAGPKFPVLQSKGLGTQALSLAIAAHLMIFLFSVQFFFVPAGSHIRPMGWAMFVGMVSIGAFFIVECLSIISLVREKSRLIGVLGLILGITPFLFGSFILHFAAWVKGFGLSE